MRVRSIAVAAAVALLLAVGIAQGRATDAPPGILYLHNVRGALSLWLLTGDGSDGRQLVPSAAEPAWSPDGSRFAFVRVSPAAGGAEAGIGTEAADGSDVHPVTSGTDSAPAWSPDGSLIVFTRRAPGPSSTGAIWVVGADGIDPRPLSQPPAGASDLEAAWSPDGSALAFVRASPPSGSAVWIVPAGGGDARQLTHPSIGAMDIGPTWSPDGSAIAFTRTTRATPPARSDVSIWSVDPRSGAETQLTATGAESSSPAWSPDGARIAFISGRDHDGRICGEDECNPASEVYVMAADGSASLRITRTRGPEESVVWSPDGRRLLYASAAGGVGYAPYQLVLANRDGSCPTPLTHGSVWHEDPLLPWTANLSGLPLRCARVSPVRALRLRPAGGPAAARVHGGSPAEAALARGLLAGFGGVSTIRSLTIARPPAGRRGAAGSSWLRLVVTGTGARNRAAAVRPSWEAGLLADAYAKQAAAHGLRPLLGLTVHYLGSGQAASATEASRHDPTGGSLPNEPLSADDIARSLRSTKLPPGIRLASLRFATVAGAAVPEIVLRLGSGSAAGRLYPLYDSLLGPLELDQGAYLEIRGRCGALLAAVGTGELGTRGRVGAMRAARC